MTTQAMPDDTNVTGMSLERILSTGKRFNADEAAPLLIEVCALLDHEHESGAIVRALTPAKIHVAEERVHLVQVNAEDVPAAPYAAPEVLEGKEVDRRADLYSLGVIAKEMTGDAGQGPEARRFAAVIDRLVVADPQQRCSSASWLAHALRVSVSARALADIDASEAATVFAAPDADAPFVPAPPALPAPVVAAPVVAAQVVEAPMLPSFPSQPSLPPVATNVDRPHREDETPFAEAQLILEVDPEDTSAAKMTWMLWLEKMTDKAKPALERLELAKKARALATRLELESRARAVAARGVKKNASLAVAAVAGILLISWLVHIFNAEPPAPPPKSNQQIATEMRAMADGATPQQAIDQLEQMLVAGGKYGEPVLHAVLARAYVRAQQEPKSLQHFAIAARKDPNVVDAVELRMLVALIGSPVKANADAAEELIRLEGDRAAPALKELGDDKATPKATKKRIAALVRGGATAHR